MGYHGNSKYFKGHACRKYFAPGFWKWSCHFKFQRQLHPHTFLFRFCGKFIGSCGAGSGRRKITDCPRRNSARNRQYDFIFKWFHRHSRWYFPWRRQQIHAWSWRCTWWGICRRCFAWAARCNQSAMRYGSSDTESGRFNASWTTIWFSRKPERQKDCDELGLFS